MKTADLDYSLPEALIAQEPIEPRDRSRLLVLHRVTGRIEHRLFRDVGEYLRAGDLLVANESRVIPARLYGHKTPSGGKVELLLLRKLDGERWLGLAGGATTRPGTTIRLDAAAGPSSLRNSATSPSLPTSTNHWMIPSAIRLSTHARRGVRRRPQRGCTSQRI